jgi:GTP cyclohydrolase I
MARAVSAAIRIRPTIQEGSEVTRAASTPIRGAVDVPRLERAVREILYALGENPNREGLLDTPRRVAKSFGELFAGLHEHPARHLGRVFEHQTEGDDLVMVRDIDFSSLC